MKYKQTNQMDMKEEVMRNKQDEEQTDTEMGMAWVKEWLRWEETKNGQREQERNYKKKVKKEEKELG